MDMRFIVLWVLGVLHLCWGQSSDSASSKGLLLNRRRYQQQSSPCWSGGSDYDSVDHDENGRKFLLAAGAAVGGAALGYHLGMSQSQHNQPIINNNIYNEYPPPCVVVQSGNHGGGGGGGGGIIGGILSHHPILSNILQGGILNGGGLGGGLGGGGRQGEINWNRAIRQFNRLVRPITRGFK